MGDVVMKRLCKFLIMHMLIFALLFMTSCSNMNTPAPTPQEEQPKPPVEEPQPDTPELKDFFPLSEGSTWQYQGEGNEYASFHRKVLFVEGDRAQVVEDNGGTVSASIFKTTEDEVIRTFFQGEEYDESNLLSQESNNNVVILKTPLQAGAKWETPEGVREILEIDATVDTPVGKFEDCIKVSILSQDSTLYEYYKDGIGLVKREFISGDMTVTSTLEKYDIK
jgi:hypothetical protein